MKSPGLANLLGIVLDELVDRILGSNADIMPALNKERQYIGYLDLNDIIDRRLGFSIVAAVLALIVGPPAYADGERDNDPRTVRRIPREGIGVSPERESALRDRLKQLQDEMAPLRKSRDGFVLDLLPDVMIFERAVRCALDYNEFFSTKDLDKAERLLEEGISRAAALENGEAPWTRQSGLVVRGFISRIDNTVQPYGVVVPESYPFDRSRPSRCDLWFHGRGETLSEVNFLFGRMTTVGQYAPEDTMVLHPYGRYSNAFKFAGEVDVLEALDDVKKRYRIDEDRISVRGFSMGGAACWQFAVHYSDRWFAANPGAGFSETPKFLDFFQKETLSPKPWEKTLWNLYDCDKYAGNLRHCPTIAYSGENDIQKQAADVMETELLEHGIRLRHIIGHNMGHKIDDDSKRIIDDALASLAIAGRNRQPGRASLETHTLKYNRMGWVEIDRLKEHWQPARISVRYGETFTSFRDRFQRARSGKPAKPPQNALVVIAANVNAFSIDCPPGTAPVPARTVRPIRVEIRDARKENENGPASDPSVSSLSVPGPFSDGSWSFSAEYADGSWRLTDGELSSLHKRHGLQGPIDDAFMDSFIFVRPTGEAANQLAGEWAISELERAIDHWRRHFRGDARVVDDNAVTDEMIKSANLVLWGDPSSNSVISKIADQLPIVWSKDQVTVGDHTYDAAEHAPILIYPNPLNQDRYVVLNSSFTFRDYAYLNNARQVPMLPDWAIVNLKTAPGNVWPGEVVAADFFDEEWKLKSDQ